MSAGPTIHNFSHDALQCRFWIRIADEDAVYARNAAEAIFQLLDDLDFQTDLRHDSGPIASINAMPEGAMVAASDHIRALWDFGETMGEESAGAFNVTAGNLFKYWSKRGELPFNQDDAEWGQVVNATREGKFKLEGCELTCVKAGAAVDFGAITRGYALDRMADMLESNWGIHRALLMASGSVTLALDPPGDSSGWRIGVGTRSEIKLCRFAFASKSTLNRHGNLVDPRSGLSVQLRSPVRAIANSAMEAEGLAMAAAVLSPAELEELLNRGCSRGAWLPDDSRLGSITYFEVTDRPESQETTA